MKAKRIMAAVAALTMCAAMPMTNVLPMMKSNVITASAAAAPESDFQFDSSTGTITGYKGAGGDIEIPSTINGVSVKAIGSYAFDSCYNLTSVEIPGSVESISGFAFAFCFSLTSVKIPDGVNSIGEYAFYSCFNLTSVKIPDGVNSIGSYAFNNCLNLTSVKIPDGVNSIGEYAFSYCESLTSVELPDSLKEISEAAFAMCGDKCKIYARNIKALLPYCFAEIKNADVYIDTIPDNVSMSDWAFYDATINLYVPEDNIAGWQKKFGWNESTLTGNAYNGTVNLCVAEKDDNFFSEFTIKHDITEKEGFTTPDLSDKEFTYTITPIDAAPALATGGKFTYDATSKEFTSKVALPADSFKNIGDYWYEIKETTTGIAGYKAEPETYYLHVVTANIGEENGGIGVRQVQLHKTYQKNIEGLTKTKLTFALPEGYKNGYSDKGESSFDWGEGESPDERETQIAYYYAGEEDMDFDVYAWKKGTNETVESAAAEETKADVTTDEINGFKVAYYNSTEVFDGKEYSTRTYLIDDGEENIVEFVFWLDENDTDANAKMQEILDTLALRPSDKTDTMTGTYSLGTLSVTVNSTGTAVKGDETFNVIAEFSLPSGAAPVDITYKINDVETGTISASDWTTDGKVKKTIANVAGGSTIKFENLPEGLTYKISEAATDGYFQNPKYTFAEPDTDENGKLLDVTNYSNVFSECYAKGTITDDADALTITNTANVPIDVGTFLESKPFMAIFGGASVLAACAFITRKKRTEDAE